MTIRECRRCPLTQTLSCGAFQRIVACTLTSLAEELCTTFNRFSGSPAPLGTGSLLRDRTELDGWYRRVHIAKKTATFFSTYAACTTVTTTSTGTYVSHHRMEGRPFGPLSNYTALVNARGAFASRYRLPKSVIPQRTRG